MSTVDDLLPRLADGQTVPELVERLAHCRHDSTKAFVSNQTFVVEWCKACGAIRRDHREGWLLGRLLADIVIVDTKNRTVTP